jgi:hypothetical protein
VLPTLQDVLSQEVANALERMSSCIISLEPIRPFHVKTLMAHVGGPVDGNAVVLHKRRNGRLQRSTQLFWALWGGGVGYVDAPEALTAARSALGGNLAEGAPPPHQKLARQETLIPKPAQVIGQGQRHHACYCRELPPDGRQTDDRPIQAWKLVDSSSCVQK